MKIKGLILCLLWGLCGIGRNGRSHGHNSVAEYGAYLSCDGFFAGRAGLFWPGARLAEVLSKRLERTEVQRTMYYGNNERGALAVKALAYLLYQNFSKPTSKPPFSA